MSRTKLDEADKKPRLTITISKENADYLCAFKNRSAVANKILTIFREQNEDFLQKYLTGEIYI